MRKNAVFSGIDQIHSPKTQSSSSNRKTLVLSDLLLFPYCFPIKLVSKPMRDDKIHFFSIWAGATSSRAMKVVDTWKNCIFSQFLEFSNFGQFWPLLTQFWVWNAPSEFGIFRKLQCGFHKKFDKYAHIEYFFFC